jgi:hypothetical protein
MRLILSVIVAGGVVAGAFYSGYQMGISKASTVLLQPSPIADNWAFGIAHGSAALEKFLNEKRPLPQNIRIECHSDIGYYVFCSPDKSDYEYHAAPSEALNENQLRKSLTDTSRVFAGLTGIANSPIIVTIAYDKKH